MNFFSFNANFFIFGLVSLKFFYTGFNNIMINYQLNDLYKFIID